jgi:hypothetical protein
VHGAVATDGTSNGGGLLTRGGRREVWAKEGSLFIGWDDEMRCQEPSGRRRSAPSMVADGGCAIKSSVKQKHQKRIGGVSPLSGGG